MNKSLKKLAQSSIFYTFANSIEALSPVFLAIILTRVIEPDEYGIWVLFIAVVTFLRPSINLSVQDALRMHFFEMNDRELASFIWSAFCLTLACTTLITLFMLVLSDQLSTALSVPARWLVTIPISAFLYAQFYFLLAYNQFANKRERFLVLHVLQTAASLLVIGYLVANGWGWQGVVVGKIIGLATVSIIGFSWMNSSLGFTAAIRRPPVLLKLAKFGLLYLPTGMGLVAIPLTDRLIVSNVLGMTQNGYFGAAALFGSAVFVCINGFLHGWMPWLFRSLNDYQNNKSEILKVSAAFYLLLPMIGIAAYATTIIVAPFIIGSSFVNAFPMIPWAIAGTVSMGFFYHNQAYLHYKKAIVPMSISSLFCIVSNGVLSYFGAIHYGVLGVLAATIVAFLGASLISGIFMVSRYRIVSVNESNVYA